MRHRILRRKRRKKTNDICWSSTTPHMEPVMMDLLHRWSLKPHLRWQYSLPVVDSCLAGIKWKPFEEGFVASNANGLVLPLPIEMHPKEGFPLRDGEGGLGTILPPPILQFEEGFALREWRRWVCDPGVVPQCLTYCETCWSPKTQGSLKKKKIAAPCQDGILNNNSRPIISIPLKHTLNS